MTPAPRLSVVIPARNEELRLRRSLPILRQTWEWDGEVELIVVDNGSADRTSAVSEQLLQGIPSASVLREPVVGKGAAVRCGVLAARGERIVFMDADLATDLRDVPALVAGLDESDVVVGSRVAADATVTGRSLWRGVLHHGFRWHARRWAGVGVSDPQCGFKAFRRAAAHELFGRMSVTGYGFDVEILLLARDLGLRIDEIPVRWQAVEGGHVRLVRDSTAMMTDLLRLRMRGLSAPPLATVPPRSAVPPAER